VTALGTAAIVLAVAWWWFDLRALLHAALLGLLLFLFLPFVIIAAGLLVALLTGLLIGLAHGEAAPSGVAEALVAGGGWLVPRYYRFLARRRHPAALGVAVGLLLGMLGVWLLLALTILPAEARTAAVLAEAREALARLPRLPAADGAGHLSWQALGISRAGVIEDGFGRPVRYSVVGRWKLAWYRLVSDGADGRPGRDDLCVVGGTSIAERIDRALVRVGPSGVKGYLSNIAAARRCMPSDGASP
jgi:hypothetical protein